MNFNNVTNWIIPEGEVIKVTSSDGTVLWKKRSTPTYDGLCFTALEDGSYGMSHSGSNQTTTKPNLQYSRDGVNWTDWFFESISVKAGDKVYFKGNNPDGIGRSDSNYSCFTSTGLFAASGDIMSILGTEGMPAWAVCRLFRGCKFLTKAPELSATILADGCYYDMFRGCTSLYATPELSATTLAVDCYRDMFSGCTSLEVVSELPATTLKDRCYEHMFQNCTSLKTAPELPAETLASSCYSSMFSSCTSLKTAPELPATTLKGRCYEHMFSSCTRLTIAPELPATTLASYCYSGMFRDCISLTTTPKTLPATTLKDHCYSYMFYNCRKLTAAPEISATKLSGYCCECMFRGCTSLTTAPDLLATTLVVGCYEQMFYGCTKLNKVKHSIINWDTVFTDEWLSAVASTGVMRCPTSSTIPSNNTSGIPSGWSRINF